jgi:parallel beta-helix repeat protein
MRIVQRNALRGFALLALGVALPACYNNTTQFYGSNMDWFVDPVAGSDLMGDGSPFAPFQTLTFAMQFTIPGDGVILATGTYSTTTHEVFPILIRPGVFVIGDPGTDGATTTIYGGGSYTITGGGQLGNPINATLIMGSGAQLHGVQVTNPSMNGPTPIGIGIVFDGDTGTVLQSTVTGCTLSGINVYQAASPSISRSIISLNGTEGVSAFDTSAPSLRQNSIRSNGTDGVLASQASHPNLGDLVTGGQNTLQANVGVGLNNNSAVATPTLINAIGNTWNVNVQGSDPVTGQYTSTLVNSPVAPAAGNNYAITNAGASIQF